MILKAVNHMGEAILTYTFSYLPALHCSTFYKVIARMYQNTQSNQEVMQDGGGIEQWLWTRPSWFESNNLVLISYGTLGDLITFSKPQFSLQQNGRIVPNT